MLLAIDVGNTNIVMAVHDGVAFVERWRMETASDLRVKMEGLSAAYPDISDIIVSSVVPKVNDPLSAACQAAFHHAPLFVSHETITIEVALEKPEEVGADRLVNAVALLAEHSAPAVIVDFGTATTFDVMDAAGRYCGGVIAPGINLSLKALEMAAAKLPDIQIEKPAKVIGGNTVEAMQSGIYWGYIGLIEGTLHRIAAEMGGTKPYVIATGGLAPLFIQGTEMIDTNDTDLTLKGLVHIHATMKGNVIA